MEGNFENNIEIADEYEYISTDELYKDIGLDLEGGAFSSSEYLVVVDKRYLPESFSIIVIGKRRWGSCFTQLTNQLKLPLLLVSYATTEVVGLSVNRT